jgi:hypothetical protein
MMTFSGCLIGRRGRARGGNGRRGGKGWKKRTSMSG